VGVLCPEWAVTLPGSPRQPGRWKAPGRSPPPSHETSRTSTWRSGRAGALFRRAGGLSSPPAPQGPHQGVRPAFRRDCASRSATRAAAAETTRLFQPTRPDRELRVLAELRRPVVVGDLALEISECQPQGIRLRSGVMRHVGTGPRLTGGEHRRELCRTAGVRIRSRSRGWRNNRERRRHGGDCCRLSHCESHCGFLSSSDLAATLRPHGWRSAGTAVASTEVPRAPHRFVT
jgi:hypothetical protein